jgi:hypothetical protein
MQTRSWDQGRLCGVFGSRPHQAPRRLNAHVTDRTNRTWYPHDLGLEDSASSKITPAADILGPFKARPPFEETFNYWSVLGKILYVSSNTRCEITLANHQCARFSIDPRSPHGVALRRIGRYLLGSRDKGMIIKPTKDLTLDCYADADFAGLFSTSDPDDPKSVKSRSGYVITSARFLSAGEANCNPRRLFPQWKPNIYLSLKRFVFCCLFVSFSMKYPTIFISNMIRTPLSNHHLRGQSSLPRTGRI